jgi:chromosome segregation protein
MIIKRLELQGFKTFPERTKIVFHTGITAIIGPNGTGKSNIVESIQWVLGGQRVRSVRGEKIDDAIFTGNSQKPALGMADVTLVLQNADEEMQINHRVFRSGESEYRLNGKTVRLKDIQDELWKKSISENKYFVIEQGAIGTFVTSKPTEKRALIEEAAGTAFYKDKKRQAENKLEDSEQNLVRLEDIIAEVAKAKNSLARQAGAAERYRKLRERIRELTALHFRYKSRQLAASQQEVQTHYDDSMSQEREIMARLSAEEKNVNQKRKDAWDLEQSLKQGRESQFSLRAQIARLEAEKERESKRIEFFEEKKKKATSDADEFLAELLLLEKDINQAREELKANAQAFDQKQREAAELETTHRETEARMTPRAKKVEACRGDYLQKFAEVTEAKNEGARIEKELELVRRQEGKIGLQRQEARGLLEEKDKEIAALESRSVETQQRIAAKERGLLELHGRLSEVSAGIESLHNTVRDLRKKRDEDAYHLQALRKLEEKERAAEPLYNTQGGLGFFTDLLESEPADAPLIDVFWKEEAKATVISAEEFLKNLARRELRGNFFLLPEIRQEQIPPPMIQDPAVVGWLKTRLRLKAKLEGGLPRLQDAVIVADIKSAIHLWFRFPDVNYVTLDGSVLLSTGLLKLGQRREGLFTLSQEIKELEKKINRHDAEILPYATQLEERAREKQNLEAEIKNEAVHRAELQTSKQQIEKELALAQAVRTKLTSDLILLGHELEVLNMDKTGFSQKWDAHAETIRGLLAEEQTLRSRATEEETEFALHREKNNREAQRLLELRGALDVLQEKINNLRALIENLTQRKDAAAAKINSLQEDIRAAEAEKARLEELLIELGQKAVDLEAQKNRTQDTLTESDQRLERIQNNLAEAETGLQKIRGDYERQKDERMTWEIRKAEIDRDLVNIEESCWQELKKTLQEVKAETPAEGAESGDFEAELEESKEKLQKFGAVNLMAEEEYLAQKERHDFLTEQRADLKEAIVQTKEAILKIDEESRMRFMNALAEINQNFQDLFVTLFKGGSAEVKLLDEENPLESGVEIIAQPPGKKVQNMGLLSGGEKSLTSLAFLFALFRYKPTPFCILDEVDAALDEVNLARFLDLMRNIKTETQFIIITHNYKTMEVADYIYGTTMEEPNITKLFSMKFEKKGEAEKVD